MRITASIFHLASVILAQVAPCLAMWDSIRCVELTDNGNTGSTKDCKSALDLIPYGPYFDPANPGDIARPDKIFDVHMGYPWRKRRHIALPAAFRSGSCVILVKRQRFQITPDHPRMPKKAAEAMYYNIWPKIRELSAQIFNACPIERPILGYTNTRIKAETNGQLGDLYAEYLIMVRAAPRNMVVHGEKQAFDSSTFLFTVYDSDEATSDQTSRS